LQYNLLDGKAKNAVKKAAGSGVRIIF